MKGGGAPTILNAANEVAVLDFLAGKIRFTDIVVSVEETLAAMPAGAPATLDEVVALDAAARGGHGDRRTRRGARLISVPTRHDSEA